MTLLFLLLSLPAFSQTKVTITEPAGIARSNEPACFGERCWYVTLGPKKSITIPITQSAPKESLKVQRAAEGPGLTIENEALLADLTARTVNGTVEDSGVLRGLLFKPAGVRLQRTENRMHWAPSFQRVGVKGYRSMAMWTPVQKHNYSATEGFVRLTREGRHAEYPEIDLWTEYRFFSYVPYFLFRSRMTIVKPIEMFWLRNQEMTMDAFFTHVAWPGKDGKPVVVDFEARKPLLAKAPLPVDVPWVAFVNLEKGYGYGAVVLQYKATKTAKPETSINDGADNGKYWDRRVINQTPTHLDPGERFEEETAYVLFRCSQAQPVTEFLDWEKRLRQPLRVKLIGGLAKK